MIRSVNSLHLLLRDHLVLWRLHRLHFVGEIGADLLCNLSLDLIRLARTEESDLPMVVVLRHRHRYEVNNSFREILEKKGLVIAGINPERNLVEIIEAPNHPFFVASQFHPEFKSRPLRPHPLFREFIRASVNRR